MIEKIISIGSFTASIIVNRLSVASIVGISERPFSWI